MAIASSLSGGQLPSIGTQIGGVTEQQSAYVVQQVALQQERRQQKPTGNGGSRAMIPASQDWEGFAFLLLGLL
mgnify:CR=1 FL=1